MSESEQLATKPIALSQGDPSGIGPEIAIKAWLRRAPGDVPFFLIADPDHVNRCIRALGLPAEACAVTPEEAAGAYSTCLPVVPVGAPVTGEPGRPDEADAAPTIAAIDMAARLVRDNRASAMTTNPITKASLLRAGFAHPGHTEFLGELADRYFGVTARPVMMLWSPDLAVVPVTIHVPLSKAITMLTRDLIVETGVTVARAMQTQFGLPSPRLAFSGLNPHAGEEGMLGSEEEDFVRPALAELQSRGIAALGPFPADTMFHAEARAGYDAALCMYHDQALIPVKTLAFDSAVNVTLGLPFVRTSPDHGTAYNIAGKGIARPDSLIAALQLAARLGSHKALAAREPAE
ncbi:MAG: 4-hydroxythreonine-4-phosphate dehydrogenase PdxA [Beijerinckiaceae bacterium]